MVSEYECRETAKQANYTWMEWLELPSEERSCEVAHRRVALAIEAHVNDAYQRKADADQRRAKRR